MNSYKRAIRPVIVSVVMTAVVASGSGIWAASGAEARPAHARTGASQDLLGLPVLELIPLDLPVLSGLGDIGSLLSVSNPVWNLPGVTTDFQWLLDGVPIPGATGSTYLPTLDDAGHQVSVLATGSLLGLLPLGLLTNALGINLPVVDATAPTATTPPTVTGDPKVGKVLTASAPTWSTDGVTNAYQWQRTGVAIPGATAATYTITADDVAKAISVKVTGTKPASSPGVATSAPVTGVIGDAPTVTTPAAITGVPKVDQVLGVSAPVWNTTGVTNTYQWKRDGVAIPGATATTYTLTGDDAGKSITATATGAKPGYTSGTTTTAAVTGLLGDALTPGTAPTISGSGQIGSLLSVDPGTWGAVTPTFTYQWLRNSIAIPGATGSTYVTQNADAAKTLTVAVSASRSGYAPGSATTSGILIAKMASTTKAALVKKKIKKGTKGLLAITLRASGATPSGAIQVFDGSRLIKTYKIGSADNGQRTFNLPGLKPGKHKLKATFKGNSSTNASSSRVVTLTVLKKKK